MNCIAVCLIVYFLFFQQCFISFKFFCELDSHFFRVFGLQYLLAIETCRWEGDDLRACSGVLTSFQLIRSLVQCKHDPLLLYTWGWWVVLCSCMSDWPSELHHGRRAPLGIPTRIPTPGFELGLSVSVHTVHAVPFSHPFLPFPAQCM